MDEPQRVKRRHVIGMVADEAVADCLRPVELTLQTQLLGLLQPREGVANRIGAAERRCRRPKRSLDAELRHEAPSPARRAFSMTLGSLNRPGGTAKPLFALSRRSQLRNARQPAATFRAKHRTGSPRCRRPPDNSRGSQG